MSCDTPPQVVSISYGLANENDLDVNFQTCACTNLCLRLRRVR